MNRTKRSARYRRKRKKFISLFRIFIITFLLIATTFAAFHFMNIGKNIWNAQSPAKDTPWNLILVNKWHYVPKDYNVDLISLSNGESVDNRIYPDLQKMLDTARSEGVHPIVKSGYRTKDEQQILMEDKIAAYKASGYSDQDAVNEAEGWVAIPGTSEHQLGIAVDLNADSIKSTNQEVYEWLENNSYKFGFIRRYNGGKKELTGVYEEPWHYRYVGFEAAKEISSQGVCLEEYLDR